jgi:phosphoglycolate phosphatase-like HAD superfamily hydrolase
VRWSKPHPFLLDALAEGLDERVDRKYYVGDMPDDMQAALRSAVQPEYRADALERSAEACGSASCFFS